MAMFAITNNANKSYCMVIDNKPQDKKNIHTGVIINIHYLTLRNVNTVAPRYNAPRYYADSDITRSAVDPDFLPPGENAKCKPT